jgi:hypothetical protein
MIMSNYSRRRASTPVNPFVEVKTRKLLEEFLNDEGYWLHVEKKNVGDWNECTDYSAVKVGKAGNLEDRLWLDSPGKGERRDWAGMWSYFQSKQPMF